MGQSGAERKMELPKVARGQKKEVQLITESENKDRERRVNRQRLRWERTGTPMRRRGYKTT
jgi:hypothetical protein